MGRSGRVPTRVALAVSPWQRRPADLRAVRCRARIWRTLILPLCARGFDARIVVSKDWRVLFRRPLLLLNKSRPFVTRKRLSRPACGGSVTTGIEKSDPVEFCSSMERAVAAREFLYSQIESWSCAGHGAVTEPDAASKEWHPRTSSGSEFGSRTVSRCPPSDRFCDRAFQGPSESKL